MAWRMQKFYRPTENGYEKKISEYLNFIKQLGEMEEEEMINALFVGAGGFIGAVMRYVMGQIPLPIKGGFPIMTLVINILSFFNWDNKCGSG